MLCHELKHDLRAEIIEECCLVAGLVATSCSGSFPVQSRLTFPGNAAAHSDLGSSKLINSHHNLHRSIHRPIRDTPAIVTSFSDDSLLCPVRLTRISAA